MEEREDQVHIARQAAGSAAAEESLCDDVETLRRAIVATRDKIWDLDVATGKVRWNRAFADSLGRCAESDGSVQWWIDRIHPEDRERATASLREAIEGSAASWTCEYRFRLPDGSWADLHDRACISRDASGKARRVTGAIQDLTEQKRAQAALRDSEELRRRIFEATDAEIAVLDCDGRILAVNSAWLKFAEENGADHRQAVREGANYLDVCRRALRQEPSTEPSLKGIEAVLRGDLPLFELDYPCHSPQEQRWFSMRVLPLRNGGVHGAVVSHREITEQKRCEIALQQSEERLRLAQQAGGVGVFDWDMVADRVVCSPELAAIFGLDPENPRTNYAGWKRWVHPDDLPRLEEQLDEWSRSTRTETKWEYRIIRQGNIRWLTAGGHLYRDASGKPLRMVGTLVDDTERREMEDALRRSETRFRELVEQSADGIFVADREGRYLDVNPAGARMLGYTAAEICTMSIADVVVPEEIKRIPVETKFADNDLVLSEWQFLRKDGSTFIGEVAGRLLPDGRLQGIVRDVTERKQAEAALRESEERLRLAAQAGRFGAYDVDVRTGAVRWSPEMQTIIGRTDPGPPVTFPGVPDFVHPEDADAVRNVFRRALDPAGDGVVEHEHRIVRPDGSLRWVLLKGQVLFSGEGAERRPVRSTGVMMDITARKEMEIQLAASLEHLQRAQDELVRRERLAILGQMAGAVAHEVRTPLAVIQNIVFFLNQTLPPEDPIRDALEEARRAVARSNHVITEMIDYAREPRGSKWRFPVGDAIRRALRAVPPSDGIELEPVSGADLQVCANPDQVTRILVSLIENAAQAMPGGGTLSIAAERDEQGRVCIHVGDTGCGIAREHQEKIFEPLFSTKVTGIGLGLAIARRYAHLNGGDLTVESEPGRGSTFCLTLAA